MSQRWAALRRMDGRLVVVALSGAYFAGLAAVKLVRPDVNPWRLWGVPPRPIPFFDLAVVTAGWDCTSAGYDVLVENPCDQFDRLANYPRLWMAGRFLGLGADETQLLGVLFAVAFLGAVLWLVKPLTAPWAAAFAVVLLSPVVMLAVERGNNDLLVFALLVAALAGIGHDRPWSRATGLVLLLVAAMLKLYPAFALVVLLRDRSRAAALRFAGAVAVLAVYGIVIREDLRLISDATPRPREYGFGIAVTLDAMRSWLPLDAVAEPVDPRAALLAAALCIAAALTVAVAAAARLRRTDAFALAPDRRTGDAFVAGAAIYLGTFAIGSNWDYRLLFLLLVLPQLFAWAARGHGHSWMSATAVAGIVATAWLSIQATKLPVTIPFADDLVLLGLFAYLATALLAVLWVPAIRRPLTARATSAPTLGVPDR